MKRAVYAGVWIVLLALTFGSSAQTAQNAPRRTAAAAVYFPERLDWQHRKPEEVGMNSALVQQAVQVAIDNETTGPRDMVQFLKNGFGREAPYDAIIGPVRDRGPASGLIVHHGYIVAEWGEPKRVDMTHSVTKTFLTTVIGLAWQKGLIHDVN